MARFLKLINGIPRGEEVSSSSTPIYDEDLLVVSTTPGAGEIQTTSTDSDGAAIIPTGTAITLPNSGSYTGQELKVYLNGKVLDDILDFNFVGAGPTYTQISFTFDLYVGDRIRFHKERTE